MASRLEPPPKEGGGGAPGSCTSAPLPLWFEAEIGRQGLGDASRAQTGARSLHKQQEEDHRFIFF